MLAGVVKHQDSLGNAGAIGVQWMTAGGCPACFLVMSGEPLHEPVTRYGPFVMNTHQEIEQTLKELREGAFIRRYGEE